jgi:abequosyltransferase
MSILELEANPVGAATAGGGPLLTFAIPTFNRLECLKMLLGSLAPQIARINAQGPKVEVLVCDNASDDGTGPYLDTLAWANGLRVTHHRRNLGADANVIHCFEHAQGPYVWICGDDDLPLEGALSAVVDVLVQDRPGLVYLPAHWHDGDLSGYLGRCLASSRIVRTDARSLVLQANAYVTFISSWVVSRDAYQALAKRADARRHAGSSLPHLEWHLTLLAGAPKLMTSNRHWLVARSGNGGGYSLFDVFITNYSRIVDDKLGGHPALRRFLRDFMLRGYLPGLVWGWRKGAIGSFGNLDRQWLQQAIDQAWPKDRLFVGALKCVMGLPKPIAKAAYTLSWLYCKIWMWWLRTRRQRGVDA